MFADSVFHGFSINILRSLKCYAFINLTMVNGNGMVMMHLLSRNSEILVGYAPNKIAYKHLFCSKPEPKRLRRDPDISVKEEMSQVRIEGNETLYS